MPRRALFFGIFLIGILLVPGVVQDAEASDHQTTKEGCQGAIANDIMAYYTAVTCTTPFDVTVTMGQYLRITNAQGSYDSILPSATYGGPGTYTYSGDKGTGTITIIEPPNVGVSFVDTVTTISGSQVEMYGKLVNNGSTDVRIYTYFHVTDNSGNYVTSWINTGNDDATLPFLGEFTIPIIPFPPLFVTLKS